MIRKNFYLPERLMHIANQVASRRGVSVSEIVRQALREFLKAEVTKIQNESADEDID